MGQAHRDSGPVPNIVLKQCQPGWRGESFSSYMVSNSVSPRQINNSFKIYLSQSRTKCQGEDEGAGASGPDGKNVWVSNGIHVAVWNMCSGCALIRRPSTSPHGSVYVVWLPGGEVVFLPYINPAVICSSTTSKQIPHWITWSSLEPFVCEAGIYLTLAPPFTSANN